LYIPKYQYHHHEFPFAIDFSRHYAQAFGKGQGMPKLSANMQKNELSPFNKGSRMRI
jgi:hypothetical protein